MSYSFNNLAAAMLVLSLGLTGCERPSSGTVATAPTPVTVSHPLKRSVGDYADFTSRTAAVESVDVRARVGGYLGKINFKEGTLVKKGDLLFQIDPRPFVAELNRAKAQVEQAKASITQSQSQLNVSEADEGRAAAGLDYQRRRLERAKRLLPAGTITQEEFDLQKSEMLQGQADLQRSKAQMASSQAAIGGAQAAVQSAEAAVALADLNVKYTNVTAPIDGQVSRYYVTEGNLVQQDVTLLTTIVSVDPIYAYADLDEHTVLHGRELIREGKATASGADLVVRLGLANEEGFPREGTVNFVDNQVSPKTGTLRVRAVFSNQDQFLSPGLFARLRIPIGEPHEALLVTDRAIDTDQGQKIVYIVDQDNKVDSRPVRLGAAHDGLRAIEAGLSPSDRVIVNGLQRVRPGVTVDPKLVEMPGTSK
jgi:membrane fusion protein, multidrug efflux system